MSGIINQAAVNYSLYYNVLNYFKTIMANHPSIGVVYQGDIAELDSTSFPKYPLGHVQVLESRFGEKITTYQIQLIIADKQKNKNNESDPITNKEVVPFDGKDDVVDIHANTLAILNDLTAYTQRGVFGFDIEDEILCEPFQDRFNNGLAGWVATFTLVTHNEKNRCLFFFNGP